jgi:hypothetical protein
MTACKGAVWQCFFARYASGVHRHLPPNYIFFVYVENEIWLELTDVKQLSVDIAVRWVLAVLCTGERKY